MMSVENVGLLCEKAATGPRAMGGLKPQQPVMGLVSVRFR